MSTLQTPTPPLPEEPLRVMSLHALYYCERLFYLEEVEELRVADAAVYAGRRLHTELEKLEDGESWVRLELEDESLGLRGKVDCIRRRAGVLIPFEHKKGRSQKADGACSAWPSDRIQAAAYGLLVEAATGEHVPEVRVRYHADGVLVRIPLDDELRQEVRDAIARARELRASLNRPPVAQNEKLCQKCSLAPVCLPEEERLVQDASYRPMRLFPPEREGQILHLTEPGARLTRAGETLEFVSPSEGKRAFPSAHLEEIVLHGPVQMTTQALALCAHLGIGVHWMTAGGVYLGSFVRGKGQVQRRIRQFEALRDPAVCEALSRRLAQARVEGQLRFLLRATRGQKRPEALEGEISAIRGVLEKLGRARGLDSIRGYEGTAGRHYFQALPFLLSPELEESLRPTGRSRRPPRDRFNAALSFGYALLHREVLSALLACGLEPSFGFYHQPRSAAHPLALDLMELFRVPMWDIPLIASLNRRQWNPEEDFVEAPNQVWLSEQGRKKAIRLYEQRRQEQWKHPVVGYSLSYSRLIELEARLLEKEWTGSPGLFARMRLR